MAEYEDNTDYINNLVTTYSQSLFTLNNAINTISQTNMYINNINNINNEYISRNNRVLRRRRRLYSAIPYNYPIYNSAHENYNQNFQDNNYNENNDNINDTYQANELNTSSIDYNRLSEINLNNIIENNTDDISFSNIDNPVNDSCPIACEDFTDDYNVCQIKHCKHNFNKNSLYNWLKTNHTCPICRYNILENSNMIKYTLNNNSSLILTSRQFSEYLSQHLINNLLNRNGDGNTRLAFAINNKITSEIINPTSND